MTLERPQQARQHITIRDPVAGVSKTFTVYEGTLEQAVERIKDALKKPTESSKKNGRNAAAAS